MLPPSDSADRSNAAFQLLEQAVADGEVPGAAAAVGTPQGTLHRAHYGWAQLEPERRPMRADALFDLASLTKIVATLTLALRLHERGLLHLDRPVADSLPEFGAHGKDRITVRHLLAHTSGLPSPVRGWREQFARREPHPPIWDLICAVQPERAPGAAVHYSDIGFFTLGRLLERIGGAPLDVLAHREVFAPLGLADTRFLPPLETLHRAAATEVVPERGGPVVGAVHDEMANTSGGVAGHAGLFSTCADLERYCRLWLNQGRLANLDNPDGPDAPGSLEAAPFLSPATIQEATRDQTNGAADLEGSPARRGLGWALQPNPRGVPANLTSPRAYGHTGFTGTSLLLDPEPGIFAVLLTNRVHPTRHAGSADRIASLRARFHDAVWHALTR